MYCNKCGKEIPDSTNFCIYCGADVSAEAVNLRSIDLPSAANARTKNNTFLAVIVMMLAVMLTGLMGWSYSSIEIDEMPLEEVEIKTSMTAAQGMNTTAQLKEIFDMVDRGMGQLASDIFSNRSEFELWSDVESGVGMLFFANLASGLLAALAVIIMFISVVLIFRESRAGLSLAQAGFIIAALAALVSIITSLAINSALDDIMRYVVYETGDAIDIKYGSTLWVFITLLLGLGGVSVIAVKKPQLAQGLR